MPLTTRGFRGMRLYFHLVNSDEKILDNEGVDISNLDEARTQALETVAQFAASGEIGPESLTAWRLEATDSSGAVAFTINLDSSLA